jgi:hypothetical protein
MTLHHSARDMCFNKKKAVTDTVSGSVCGNKMDRFHPCDIKG